MVANIASTYSSMSQDSVSNWINQELVKIDPNQAMLNELSRGSDANPATIVTALADSKFADGPSGFGTLTISEQALVHACNTNNPKLFEDVCKALEGKALEGKALEGKGVIDYAKITTNTSSNSYSASIEALASNPSQAVFNELSRGLGTNPAIIVTALADSKFADGPSGFGSLKISEQALALAYDNNDLKLFEDICNELNKKSIKIDSGVVANIASIYNSMSQNSVSDWINQELAKIDPNQAIINEFNRGQEPDKKPNQDIIITALSNPKISLDNACGLNNGFSIKAQAVAEAYKVKNPKVLDAIKNFGLSNSQLQDISNVHFSSHVDSQGFNCWMSQQLAGIDLNTIQNQGAPVIQDIAVIAEMLLVNPTGEYIGYQPTLMTNLERDKMCDRLNVSIDELMNIAERTYQKDSNNGADIDHITRLSANEFFFYTIEPLTLKEFEELQNKIAMKAETLSPGVQLIHT